MSSISFHAVAILPMIRGLHNLSHILTKGESHAVANSIDPTEYINARLAPDMDPLPQQIWRLTDSAKLVVSRVTDLPALTLPDTEKTFPELQARIKKVVEYLEGIDPKEFEGKEEREITLYTGGPPGSGIKYEIKFPAREYVAYFAHPNFWFHTVTAYGLLRSKGVDVGKMDYLNGANLISPKAVPKD